MIIATQVPNQAWSFELQEAGKDKPAKNFEQGSKVNAARLQSGFTMGAGNEGGASIGYQVETKKDVFWNVTMNFHPDVDHLSGTDDHSVRIGTTWRF
jgi:hypothetical protein